MKFNKREVVQRLIEVPDKGRRAFWAKQMAIFNKLLDKFPKEDFWRKVCFPQKYQGMEYLLSEYGLVLVSQKYREFNYKIHPAPTFSFNKNIIGEAPTLNPKPNTLNDFLQHD